MRSLHSSPALEHGLLFLHDETLLQRLMDLIQSPGEGRVVWLRGAPAAGRDVVLAAAQRVCARESIPVRIETLNLDGYEPHRGAHGIQAFVDYVLCAGLQAQRCTTAEEHETLCTLFEPNGGAIRAGDPLIGLLFGVLRNLEEPLAKLGILDNTGDDSKEPAQSALGRLLARLSQDSTLLLCVSDEDTILSDPLCKALLDAAACCPNVIIVFSCDSSWTDPYLMKQRGWCQPLDLEVRPLERTALAALLSKHNRAPLPQALEDALWDESQGHSGALHRHITWLVQRKMLHFDKDGSICADKDPGPLGFAGPAQWLSRWLSAQGTEAQALRHLLTCASLCGETWPDELLRHHSGCLPEAVRRLSERVGDDTRDRDAEETPVLLRSIAGTHPSLPAENLYAFCDPYDPHAMVGVLDDDRETAESFLSFLVQTIGDGTRGATHLLRNVTRYIDQREAVELEVRLRLWCGPQHARTLEHLLTEDVRQGHQDPETLWHYAKSGTPASAQERLALLAAYGAQPGGIPADHYERYCLLHAQALYDLGSSDDAEACVAKVLSALPEGGHDHVRWEALHLQGCCRQARGAFEQALSSFRYAQAAASAAIEEGHLGHEVLGLTMHEMGRCQQDLGDHAQAMQCFEQGIDAQRKGDSLGRVDHRSIAIALYELGNCPIEGRNHERELEYFEQAIAEHRKGDIRGRVDHDGIGIALHEMGRRQRKHEALDHAVMCFEQALEEARRGDILGRVDSHGLGMTWHELGRCHQQRRDFKRACQCYMQAIENKQQGDALGRIDHRSIGITWHAIGQCCQATKDFEEGLACFDEALEATRKGDALGRVDHHSIGSSAYQKGLCYQALCDPVRATACFELALHELERGDLFGSVDPQATAAVRRAADECLSQLP